VTAKTCRQFRIFNPGLLLNIFRMLREEEKRMLRSMVIPGMIVLLMWAVRIIETIGGYEFAFLGIFPLKWAGMPGIVTSPFIHADFSHLAANTLPMIILGTGLFYFYRDIALRILILIWLFTGIWVWIGAREAWHIGASGIVYGLAAFILLSGILRRHTGLMAMALVVVFLYGSLIWGVFPEFFPNERISWESHLFGMIAGVSLAIYYRKEGPQRRRYDWEDEEDDDLGIGGLEDLGSGGFGDGKIGGLEDLGSGGSGEVGKEYWNVTLTDQEIKEINQVYRRKN
jgi:membrane associated rhomboid family serine protease